MDCATESFSARLLQLLVLLVLVCWSCITSLQKAGGANLYIPRLSSSEDEVVYHHVVLGQVKTQPG